jgi:hypothetical protein
MDRLWFIKVMNINKQQIAIAEFCGARWYQVIGGRVLSFNTLSPTILKPDTGELLDIPNYPEDLNAIHEAEKLLTPIQKHTYAEHLFQIVGGYDDYYDGIVFTEAMKIVYATPSQRAEALLRTIGKWEEGE